MAPLSTTGNRPRPLMILTAAFLAGGAAAVGLNHFLDVHLSQRKPVVESEPIFIAMRSLPSGAPVTVWDVALRNWPIAMMPTTAMRVEDSFDGMCLKMPLREGQPLLSVQLEPAAAGKIAKMTDHSEHDERMVIVDDRTKIQLNWPKPPLNDSAGASRTDMVPPSAETRGHASPAPQDDRLAIRPMQPAVTVSTEPVAVAGETPAVGEAPATVAVPPAAQPEQASLARVNSPTAAVSEGPIEAELAVTSRTPSSSPAATTPGHATPEREQLPEIRIPQAPPQQTPTPVLTEIAATPANPSLSSVMVPGDRLSAVPPAKPTVPSSVVMSKRHLVVPERIAVMVDEVTAAARQQESANAPGNANTMRRLPQQSPETAAPPRESRSDLQLEPTQQPVGGRMPAAPDTNPLRKAVNRGSASRSRPQSPAMPQPLPSGTAIHRPMSQQPVANRLPSSVPEKTRTTRQENLSPESDAMDAAESESRMFPRVSARLEKAGEDWSRFRQSIFGSDQE